MIPKSSKKMSRSINTLRSKELTGEIKYLRSVTKDVIVRYSLKIHSSLMRIVQVLEPANTKDRKVRRPTDKTMREMISRIRSLKVKTKKGRAKDLARIEVIAKKLNDLMPYQP